jgi:nitrogen fixation protein FixH
MKPLATALMVTAIGGVALGAGPSAPDRLIVHEWGTITTRHAPDGTPQGRLNRIAVSEVLPAFVHRYEPPGTHSPATSLQKAPLTPGRPDVTMRLETPVVYFYPPAGANPSSVAAFDVSVSLRGGVLNEFYPRGDASVQLDVERVNLKMRAGALRTWDGAVLDNYLVGSLRWSRVTLKEATVLPQTASHVWLAPRAVRATAVAASGEGERYLFYRGVAHLDALVQTQLSGSEIRLSAPRRLEWLRDPGMTIGELWILDVRSDGHAAFREHKRLVIAKDGADRELARIPLFAERDYSASGLGEIRGAMRRALISAGLFEEEADAMLDTWKAEYFDQPGLRVLYIVPPEWIAYYLPLTVSAPHALTRVLVGRIDLAR